jgi:diaminohydroxyphosphoribosylaminopyrimidine deaminase/5-amino-6-(5-phosphoribosylamino)uracil reductase
MLALAARAGRRGMGLVEPNPMVGAVLARDERVLGIGHHRKFGGPHAEIQALARCRALGHDPRGSTLYATLEPCASRGKQPACALALIEAGVERVVAARPDPHPTKGGGAELLRAAGIPVEFTTECEPATRLADPFVHRLATGRPWVIAKWAQTESGDLRRGADGSRWISGEPARRRVHRLRARVDAVLTGIGTVLVDDPMLTARGVRVRRVARRVIVDPRLELPPDSALVRTCRDVPVTAACLPGADPDRAHVLRDLGVEVIEAPQHAADGRMDLAALLVILREHHHSATAIVEAGPRLLESFLHARLVDEAVAYVAATRQTRMPRAGPGALLTGFDHIRARALGPDMEHTFFRAATVRERPR